MAVTLEDIANATGYDKSTVSVALRNLSGSSRFSQQTRERILATADRLGYRPNFFAQQLSGRTSRLLMLCVNHLRDPFAMMVAEGFEARAAELDLRVLITALRDRQDPLEMHRDVLGRRGAAAMALVGGDTSKLSDDAIRKVAGDGVNVVLINRRIAAEASGTRRAAQPVGERAGMIGHVGVNDHLGGRLAAEHVYAQGVTEVWALGGQPGTSMEGRLAGFAEAAAARQLPPPRVLSCGISGQSWAGSAEVAVSAALAVSPRPPQAILAVSDMLAIGAGRALAKAGLVPGRDVAVTGYDGGIHAECATPALTTVRLPMVAMGRAAVDALVAMMSDAENTVQPDVVLPIELVVGESGRYAPADGGPARSAG